MITKTIGKTVMETVDKVVKQKVLEKLGVKGDLDDYLVLTDEEADEIVREAILRSAWVFPAYFLASVTGLSEEIFETLQYRSEGANDVILRLIRETIGYDEFVEKAIYSNGRAYFIAYGSREVEVEVDGETFYVYCIN